MIYVCDNTIFSKCTSCGVIITCKVRLHLSELKNGKDAQEKKASSISTFYRFIVHNGNLCKVTSITELSYLSADENNGINCDFPEIEERERRGPNLLPPVFCISYSLFLGLIPLVPFRLQNIRHCCVIFPYFSHFPPF